MFNQPVREKYLKFTRSVMILALSANLIGCVNSGALFDMAEEVTSPHANKPALTAAAQDAKAAASNAKDTLVDGTQAVVHDPLSTTATVILGPVQTPTSTHNTHEQTMHSAHAAVQAYLNTRLQIGETVAYSQLKETLNQLNLNSRQRQILQQNYPHVLLQ